MCVVLDANQFGAFVAASAEPQVVCLREWLAKDGALVFGGTKYLSELDQSLIAKRQLATLSRAGKARLIPKDAVDADERHLINEKLCVSNDEHVVALLRVSGARTVFTQDKGLMADIKNKSLVDGPRGSVFQSAAHAHLLAHSTSCKKR